MLPTKFVILCVDDEENPLVLRKFLLQRAGYDVITAKSAYEALEIAEDRAIDLVVSDHLMPGLTGTELAQQLKSQYPKVPIVLLSGLNEIPPGAEAADVFLSKLEGPDQLCRTIANLLGNSNSR
jgi:CheY-like chemotaxis protein